MRAKKYFQFFSFFFYLTGAALYGDTEVVFKEDYEGRGFGCGVCVFFFQKLDKK